MDIFQPKKRIVRFHVVFCHHNAIGADGRPPVRNGRQARHTQREFKIPEYLIFVFPHWKQTISDQYLAVKRRSFESTI
jgi:hypothetical protein